MYTKADAEAVLKNELKQWAIKQGRNVYGAYYLYYIEATAEHDGGLLIAENVHNPEYKLASGQRIGPSGTVDQWFNEIRLNILGSLPILSETKEQADERTRLNGLHSLPWN